MRGRECNAAQKETKVKSKSEQGGKNGRAEYMEGKLKNELSNIWCIMKYAHSSS